LSDLEVAARERWLAATSMESSTLSKTCGEKPGVSPVHHPRSRSAHAIASAGVRFGVLPTKIR